jgi:type 1 glutamine amidotransferase
MRNWCFLLMILMLVQCGVKQPTEETQDKIKLLILSGSNNHEWQKTTPLLVRLYNESGRFEADVTESLDSLTYENLTLYDAVVSNFTAWPAHDYRMPKPAEDGLMKFIEEGGGFVLFHASSSTFYDWEEYQQMVGTSWGDSTEHGKITPHKIIIKDKNHPVTVGMSDFWITDELWVKSGVNSNLNVLVESYSDPLNKGRGVMEPVVHWNSRGNGRIFHNILGHNERAMKNTGWKILMLRGTEWAASGEVSIPVPASLSYQKPIETKDYSWGETDTTLALMNNGHIIWQYNFNTIKGKPFFHPVNINNSTITWLSPDDHPWHLGIWHSWKFINGVNYWEYDLSEGVPPFNFLGVTEVRNIKIEKGADYSCIIHLDVFYHEKNGPDLLKERRVVHVSPPNKKDLFFIDYELDMTALVESVELNRTPLPHEENGKDYGGYAGLSVRFNQDLFEPSFISPEGSEKMDHGLPSAWKYYGLRDIRGDRLGAAIFTSTSNLSYPEPWFMTNNEDHPFYYFSPAPIFNQPHSLKKGDKFALKYRMKFYSGKASKELLDQDYKHYLKQ